MSDDRPPAPIPTFPPELLGQLGLPPTFAPVPLQWHMARLRSSAEDVAASVTILIFDSPTGRTAFALRDDDARRFADQLIQQLTGLHVAQSIQTLDGTFRRPEQ